MAASGPVSTGSTQQWTDSKRSLWLIGLVVPSLSFVGFGMWALTGKGRGWDVGVAFGRFSIEAR